MLKMLGQAAMMIVVSVAGIVAIVMVIDVLIDL